jgi:DNA (cytosine-5)-methyltransferase 1
MYVSDLGIDLVVANELLPRRAEFFSSHHKNTHMIVGDIEKAKDELIKFTDLDLLIATPPCQGVSLLGKNKSQDMMVNDFRNFLIYHVFEIIDNLKFSYILIENVPRYLDMLFPFDSEMITIKEIIERKYGEEYNFKFDVLNAMDFGVPQNRKRAIIKMWKKGLVWKEPIKLEKKITMREAIGHLPSLESEQKSDIKYHYARKHTSNHITWMQNTPTGKSATENEVYYPQKDDGSKIRCFSATYKRMNWDDICPTITTRSDAISTQTTVHPGRKNKNGTYSDARVLSLKELFILFGLKDDFQFDDSRFSDTFIRQILGESVPPKLTNAILKGIIND